MKIILSRKGFDSGYGRVASPIFPDGSMHSLPIPAARSAKRYGEVAWPGGCLGDLASSLTRGKVHGGHLVHLDPDLNHAALPRHADWRPAFGQEKAAQGHLAAQGVGVGDLFLFFGWFRRVEAADGGWRYVRGEPDLHVLFGWLQVGEVLDVGADLDRHRRDRRWLADHPHLNAHGAPGNTVYLAADRLRLGDRVLDVAGGGTFPRFHDVLRLSKAASTRTVWDLPGWFHPDGGAPMTYHGDLARWSRHGDRCSLRSVAKGQEFVMDCSAVGDANPWIEGLHHAR